MSLSLCLVCRPALADETALPDGCRPPDEGLVRSLLEWIGDATDYDVSGALAAPPAITFCLEGETVAYADATTLVEPNDMALYDIETRRVMLVAPWDPANPRDVAALLHELVHDVQFQSRGFDCIQQAEWEAYKLHARWLEERGIEPEIDWLRVYLLSRCPRTHHPD